MHAYMYRFCIRILYLWLFFQLEASEYNTGVIYWVSVQRHIVFFSNQRIMKTAAFLLTSAFFTCRLDPALIRPGRVDFIKEIGHCTNWQLQRMFSRFYPEADAAQLSEFATEIEKISHPVSPAMIQGHFMYHKVWPNGACFGGHVACFCGLIVHYLGRKLLHVGFLYSRMSYFKVPMTIFS